MMDERLIDRFRKRYNLLVVLGPTASGKTGLAVRLARWIGGEIISADSRQVYRGMDLGTGKDLSEYGRGEEAVPHHLIDIVDPAEEFNLFRYVELFYRSFREITVRGRIPLLVGGTGLYLDAVLRGYHMPAVPRNEPLRTELAGEQMESLRNLLVSLRPDLHNSTDLQDRERATRAIEIARHLLDHPDDAVNQMCITPLVIGIHCERAALRRMIAARLFYRLEAGMIEEVRRLREGGISWKRIDSFGLEYRYVGLYLQGIITREEMVCQLNTRIGQYAKRQETWFRGMERKGVTIHWINGPNDQTAMALIEKLDGQ